MKETHLLGAVETMLKAYGQGRSRQVLLVTTADWHRVRGRVDLLEKSDGKHWHSAMNELFSRGRIEDKELRVTVGKAGMAWPRQEINPLHAFVNGKVDPSAPKREGDSKTPVFAGEIRDLFTNASPLSGLKMKPRVVERGKSYWVDDVGRPELYNRWVTWDKSGKPPWSAEALWKPDAYRLAFVLGYNMEHTVPGAPYPGAGSAIFAHPGDRRTGSAGCPRLREDIAKYIAQRLDPKMNPAVVIATEPVLVRIAKTLALDE